MPAPRLTPAQLTLLRRLALHRAGLTLVASTTRRTASAMLSRGLVTTSREQRGPGSFVTRFHITPEGRAALRQQEQLNA